MGIALVGLVAWRALAPRAAPAAEDTAPIVAPGVSVPPPDAPWHARSDPGAPQSGSAPEASQLKAQFLMAKARQTLGQAYERSASHGDFALAPGRILKSLLERRCGLVQRHAQALAVDAAGLCRELLFAAVKERLALSSNVSEARFWELLTQVDEAYERLVVADPSTARDEAFRAAFERFREARRGIVGADLDRRLFGLADEVLRLPFQVEDLLHDPKTSAEQKLAAYEETLQRIERESGVRLASVVEPLELAKHALRLQEAAGPLGPEQRQAVLARYAGPETAERYLANQQEQQDRSERLHAFNQERDALLEQLARAGLGPEQRRQRMAEIDQQLFEKYRLQ
ncbi:hypothetical protein DB31_5411 [Hyalangium minutum]|uniref:Lipase helper protein n=1 Tax=Hyalangium minutum TaxID=394096 RepID=A0A085WRQ6_9BACT|nr:hypothetical protein DB31_5411 [Hyalangium minutum]